MKMNKALAAALAFALTTTPLYANEETKDAGTAAQNEQPPEKTVKSTFSISTYDVLNDKGESIDQIKKGEKFTLVIDAVDTSVSTKDALEQDEISKINQTIHSLNINRLTDGFTKGDDPQVVLLSKELEPLKVKIIIKNLSWKGKSDQFRFRIGYSALDIDYTDHAIGITECGQEQKEDKEPEENPDTSQPPEGSSGSYDGGGFYSGTDPASPSAAKSAAPNLIVRQYSYGKDPIYSGKEFELTLEFYNTSKTIATENIVVSLETGEGLSITNSSNTFYFESLAPQASKVIKLKMKALTADKNSSPAIEVGFRYDFVDDGERMNQQMAEKISIPVYLKDRFEIDDPIVPEMAAAGSECALSFNYVNKGKGAISNVEAAVEGNIPALQKTQHIGNIESGSSGSIDVILIPDQPGLQKGTVVISYENANEDLVEQKFPFELNVTEPQPIDMNDNQMIEEEQRSGFSWLAALIAVGAAAVAVVLFRKLKKKKHDPQPEEEDLNFDDEDDK
ncbi:hypothetical protein [uncultured Dubosiella sp.]|uniref:hypothetical protein n=1 Tax=uncultured Dubosiella sp. TaxID=1937011 RepID=UPI00262DA8BA|nr:hypothetical protein [uncultured Dubosiella sp.]